MQIEMNQAKCPSCGVDGLSHVPVLHHMVCAYVGPEYDFSDEAGNFKCPKCLRSVVSNDPACEILGTSARCGHCGDEMPVFPQCDTSRPTDQFPERYSTKITGILRRASPASSSTSQLVRRTQPDETFLPTFSGSAVPWMP